MKDIFCYPDICPNCQYIGKGDSICDETLNIVLADWEPTGDYMRDCPFEEAKQELNERKKWQKGVKKQNGKR